MSRSITSQSRCSRAESLRATGTGYVKKKKKKRNLMLNSAQFYR